MSDQLHTQLAAASLEEASDLFVRRCQYLDPPHGGLAQVLEVDSRLDACLDLLFYVANASESAAADVDAASVGALYASARTMVRLGRWEAWGQLAEKVRGFEDDSARLLMREPTAAQALAAAAAHEASASNFSEVEATLASGGDSPLANCLAYAAGYQRWDVTRPLVTGLKAGVNAAPTWLWALGQIDEAGARETLLPFLESPDPRAAGAAAMSLCRTEDDQVARWLAAQARNQLWAPPVLALLGGPQAAPSLAKHIETGDHFATRAAGLLGDGALVPALLRALAVPDLAGCAAQALHLITGQAPVEEGFIDDEGDRRDGQLAESQTAWEEALSGASLRFAPAIRYRMGDPATPLQSISALRSPHLRQELRALVIDELFVRYGLGVHLRPDHPAARQLRVLTKLEQFLPQMATQPAPGSFPFQGRQGVG